jgi:parvulin-like peptidyl-prolyl isomerase
MTIKINGEPLPEQAVEFELKRLIRFYLGHMSMEQIQGQMEALRQKAKEQAIGARLLVDEARRLAITVGDDQVEERLAALIKQAGGWPAFEALLVKQKLTLQGVKDGIRQGRMVDTLVERITADVPEPSEKQLREHFEAHADEYRKPERAQAQHILIKPASAGAADRETARSKLLEIRDKIREGASFAEQAAAHSECPSGRKTGGSLGWFSRGMMLPELEKALFPLQIGEVSDVVETPLGLHIVGKIGSEPASESEFDDVRDKIREFLRHAWRGEVIGEHVEELRQKAVVEED